MRADLPTWILAATGLLTGCASVQPAPSGVWSTEGITVVQTGQVMQVRDVTVYSRHSSGIGAFTGAILGGIAGSVFGDGNGRAVAILAGATGGSLLGQYAEQSKVSQAATELTIRYPNGEVGTYRVARDARYRVGDTVKVSTNRGVSRVVH